MKSRTILSVSPGERLSINGSLIVTGDVCENAKLDVKGHLEIKGRVKAGAKIKAMGNMSVNVAIGPNTVIKSDGHILINWKIGDVDTIARGSCVILTSLATPKVAERLLGSNVNTFFNRTPPIRFWEEKENLTNSERSCWKCNVQ